MTTESLELLDRQALRSDAIAPEKHSSSQVVTKDVDSTYVEIKPGINLNIRISLWFSFLASLGEQTRLALTAWTRLHMQLSSPSLLLSSYFLSFHPFPHAWLLDVFLNLLLIFFVTN
jgi:hypothetical protein